MTTTKLIDITNLSDDALAALLASATEARADTTFALYRVLGYGAMTVCCYFRTEAALHADVARRRAKPDDVGNIYEAKEVTRDGFCWVRDIAV